MGLRILGFIMARDEWPLLAIAIAHALRNAVDTVAVVDHGSVDETADGLTRMQEIWHGRIKIFRLDGESFLQEATMNMVMAAVNANSYDWVYAFDADEFILAKNGKDLPEVLSRIPSHFGSVRYELQQWLAPSDMDDFNIDHYRRIVHRTVPCNFTQLSPEILADEIKRHNINFFDQPFESKLIVRGRYAHVLTAGAHSLRCNTPPYEMNIHPDELSVGHLPILSRRRLLKRARHGQALIDAGLPSYHGWQNQMLTAIQCAGQLEEFWTNHSDSGSPAAMTDSSPTRVLDLSLRDALSQAIASCDPHIWAVSRRKSTNPSKHDQLTTIPLSHTIKALHDLIIETKSALAERDSALAERDSALAERDSALEALEAIQQTKIWRSTAWIRRLRMKLMSR